MRPALARLAVAGRAVLPWVLLCAVTVGLFGPVFETAVRTGVSDFRWHARVAREWAGGGPLPTPHFLFQALLVLCSPLGPASDWTGQAVGLAVACQAALALVLTAFLRAAMPPVRPALRFLAAASLALALMVAAPVTFGTWQSRNLYHGYVGLAVYHNPTIILLRPLAVLLWWDVARLLGGTPRPVAPLALLTIGSALAKPSHLIALLPAATAMALALSSHRRPPAWRALALGLLGPAAAALGWQFAFHFGGGSSLAWAPLQAMAHPGADLAARFLLSVLFPVVTLVTFPGAWRRSVPLILAGTTFLVGTAYAYLLAEADFVSARNFTWSAQAALFVLFVAAVRALLEEAGRGGRPGRAWRFAACGLAFSLHVVCGIYYGRHPTWW